MANASLKSYQPIPKWREERESLVQEVHGRFIDINHSEQPRKVSSREKAVRRKLKTKQLLDNQKFHDFLLACEGVNTVSFTCQEDSHNWIFMIENYQTITDHAINNNLECAFNEYDSYAAELLTMIHNIKRYVKQFESNFNFGCCIGILADEINRFMQIELKNRLKEIYLKPDFSKTIMQSIFLMFNEPIRSMEKFLLTVDSCCAVGGFLLNLIKKERDAINSCYQSSFRDILTRAYMRGMDFYLNILFDWLSSNNLDSDLFFEFFIWDSSKRRCSSAVAQPKSLIIGYDELIYLESVIPLNYYNPIDIKTFKRQYLVVPELWPVELGDTLRSEIIKIGLYNHVLMLEDRSTFDAELGSKVVQKLNFDDLCRLPSLIKTRYRHGGNLILRHLCNQFEFAILMEKLPIYFCGIKNSVIDNFIKLSENFNWSGLSQQKDAKLNMLNRLYQRAIDLSPLANDSLSQMISLDFASAGQSKADHPSASQSITDLELILFCKDSFRMAFPSTVFESYKNLFRLRHTLRRVLILLKNKHFTYRRELSRVEMNALALMIRFVHAYDNFVFGYKAPKLVCEYLQIVKEGVAKKSLDLDNFLKEQDEMLAKLRSSAFLSSNQELFTNPMWEVLTQMLSYARGTEEFSHVCMELCRMFKKIKRSLRSQVENDDQLPEISEWIFGKNIRSSNNADYELRLCEELQKSYLVDLDVSEKYRN